MPTRANSNPYGYEFTNDQVDDILTALTHPERYAWKRQGKLEEAVREGWPDLVDDKTERLFKQVEDAKPFLRTQVYSAPRVHVVDPEEESAVGVRVRDIVRPPRRRPCGRGGAGNPRRAAHVRPREGRSGRATDW